MEPINENINGIIGVTTPIYYLNKWSDTKQLVGM